MVNTDTPEFRATLEWLIKKAVDSACAYDGAGDNERMAHVIGYLIGKTDLFPGPIFERLFSNDSSQKEQQP